MTPAPGTSHPATVDGFLPEGATPIGTDLRIAACADTDFLRTRFVGHVAADRLGEVPPTQSMIVTGYGPTNAPTVAPCLRCWPQAAPGLHSASRHADRV